MNSGAARPIDRGGASTTGTSITSSCAGGDGISTSSKTGSDSWTTSGVSSGCGGGAGGSTGLACGGGSGCFATGASGAGGVGVGGRCAGAGVFPVRCTSTFSRRKAGGAAAIGATHLPGVVRRAKGGGVGGFADAPFGGLAGFFLPMRAAIQCPPDHNPIYWSNRPDWPSKSMKKWTWRLISGPSRGSLRSATDVPPAVCCSGRREDQQGKNRPHR